MHPGSRTSTRSDGGDAASRRDDRASRGHLESDRRRAQRHGDSGRPHVALFEFTKTETSAPRCARDLGTRPRSTERSRRPPGFALLSCDFSDPLKHKMTGNTRRAL